MHSKKLKSLSVKIKELEAKYTYPNNTKKNESNSYKLAMNIILELFAGVMVGLGIGYAVDSFFNTKPWGLIIFLLFGFVAGFLNLYRYIKKEL